MQIDPSLPFSKFGSLAIALLWIFALSFLFLIALTVRQLMSFVFHFLLSVLYPFLMEGKVLMFVVGFWIKLVLSFTYNLLFPVGDIYFIFLSIGVPVSLRAPRLIPRDPEVNDYVSLNKIKSISPQLIPRDPEVNDHVSLQWSWSLWYSNRWPLGSKPMVWPVKLHLSGLWYWFYLFIYFD
jgi:hypothetical protein